MKPTSVPTATPTARVRASMPTKACSMTPATGIIAKAITSTMVNGLPLTSPAKKITKSMTAVSRMPAMA